MAEIVSNSITLFRQNTPPTGWTKITTYNDYMLRIVSGVAGSGGSVNFSTLFTSVTPAGTVSGSGPSQTAATTLSTGQIPSHTHNLYQSNTTAPTLNRVRQPEPSGPVQMSSGPVTTVVTGSAGGGLSHQHPFSLSVTSPGFTGNALNLAVKYADVILAERD